MNERFEWPIRVYYEDTDAQGVVYYANYFRFLERARTEWLRSLGVDQVWMLQEAREMFVVASTSADFLSPARFNDEIIVSAALAGIRRVTFDIAQDIYRGGDKLLESTVRVAMLDADSLRPKRIPKDIFEGRNNGS